MVPTLTKLRVGLVGVKEARPWSLGNKVAQHGFGGDKTPSCKGLDDDNNAFVLLLYVMTCLCLHHISHHSWRKVSAVQVPQGSHCPFSASSANL